MCDKDMNTCTEMHTNRLISWLETARIFNTAAQLAALALRNVCFKNCFKILKAIGNEDNLLLLLRLPKRFTILATGRPAASCCDAGCFKLK